MDKRANFAELENLYTYCAALSIVESFETPRLSSAGTKRLRTVRTMMGHILEEYFATMPVDQLEHVRRQLPLIRYTTGVSPVAVAQDAKRFGRFLTFEEIRVLMEGCADKCLMCDRKPGTVKACKLRKLLSSLPVEIPLCLDEVAL